MAAYCAGAFGRDFAVDEGPGQMPAGAKGGVAGGVEARNAAGAVLVDPHAGEPVSAAQIDLRGPELDFAGAEIDVAARMEPLAHRALGGKQNVFDLADLVLGQVIHADAHGAAVIEEVLHAHALDGGVRLVPALDQRR